MSDKAVAEGTHPDDEPRPAQRHVAGSVTPCHRLGGSRVACIVAPEPPPVPFSRGCQAPIAPTVMTLPPQTAAWAKPRE